VEDLAMDNVQRHAHSSWPRVAALLALPVAVALLWVVTAIMSPGAVDQFVLVWGVSSTVTPAVGVLILWRRPGHPMGRLLVSVGLLYGASAALSLVTSELDPFGMRFPRITPWVTLLAEILGTTSLLIGSVFIIVRFPSGRRTSRLGLIIELLVLCVIPVMVLAQVAPALAESLAAIAALPALVAYPLAVVDIVFRYRGAPVVERAQFRWLIGAASVTGALVIVMMVAGDRFEWLWYAWIVSTILPTVAIGIAVLRYRLYDIDRIISRTIAYAGLSVVLFGLFFATNLLLQGLISGFTGGSAVATAGSTLLVASLFQPVRQRIQHIVDRRFHRAHYDADRTVGAFADRRRDDVDLGLLVRDLRQTMSDTVDPTSATVWLRAASR
jgi:hypothetical protein